MYINNVFIHILCIIINTNQILSGQRFVFACINHYITEDCFYKYPEPKTVKGRIYEQF